MKFLFIFFSSINLVFAITTLDIENYLNNLKTLKTNFIQDDLANEKLVEGILYLSRPGKMRLDYTNPFKANLFVSGNVITYYDKELEEISNIPISSTPLRFLLDKKISFKKDIEVQYIKELDKGVIISLYEIEKPETGHLILVFDKPLKLKEIKIVNELEQEISMTFFNTETNTPIKNSTFDFINPRFKKKI
jgi:outer membrane lipoprotein-sorting protein